MLCMLYIVTVYGTMILDQVDVPCDRCPAIGQSRVYDSEEYIGYGCAPVKPREG
ncbi:MAG: hypothetical protein U1E53_30690 [Dongiaceae bacterium]